MFERPFKLKNNDQQRVFFTSDTHFSHNHEFIYKARGYDNREEHDNALIKKINGLVRPEDILFHLGDFCLNLQDSDYREIVRRINCQNIHYIWGNHNSRIRKQYEDAVLSEFKRDDIEVYPLTVGKLTYQGYYREITVEGQQIVLHHYPHDVFNQQRKRAWQLSGHSHGNNPKTQIQSPNQKILDVGWDAHKRPLSFKEIQKIMGAKALLLPKKSLTLD